MKTLALATLAIGAAVTFPGVSQAGWSSRIDNMQPVVPTERIQRVAPMGENYKFPTRADKVQGMPPYSATLANSPYANAIDRPAPAAVPPSATNDPAYYDHALGNDRY